MVKLSKNITNLILSLLGLIFVVAVFTTIWNPASGVGLYDYGVNLINDSDFRTQWGAGLADTGIRILAASPFLVGIILFGSVLHYGQKAVTEAGRGTA